MNWISCTKSSEVKFIGKYSSCNCFMRIKENTETMGTGMENENVILF